MSNQLELRHYRYFLAVAEELHFRKAAEKLYISQPGLSRQIKQLEHILGFSLFDRNNKRVTLTIAGVYLQQELKRTLKTFDNIVSHAKLLSEGKEGKINMGYVGSAMQEVIPNLLLQFTQKHPNIHFGLEEIDNNKQVNALLSQTIDVGFIRLSEVPKPLEIRSIWKETFTLILPKNHLMTKENFKNITQLKDDVFISFDKTYSEAYHARIMSIFEDGGFSPNISHYTVHANTIYKLVENNFGIAIVPTSLQIGYNMNVKFIELTNIPQRATLSICWNTNNRNPIVEQFLEIAGV